MIDSWLKDAMVWLAASRDRVMAVRVTLGIGVVYNSVKQIVATFGTQNRNLFNKVVLVEYPRKGMWTLGFLTSKEQGSGRNDPGRSAPAGSRLPG